jgi:DNA replication and repair protein RecF
VLFSPEDIDLILGAPGIRRKYLNLVLIQTDLKYKKCLFAYHHALIRRNKLLEAIRENSNNLDQLAYWNSKILEYGEYLQEKREELIIFLNNYYKKIPSENNFLQIEYKVNLLSPERLAQYRQKEIAAATTLIGPHRDDFIFLQNDLNMQEFASRGEQRIAVFFVKMAEFEYIKTQINDDPIVLLDDIFSELDEIHQKVILSSIKKPQTLITTSTSDVSKHFEFPYIINL